MHPAQRSGKEKSSLLRVPAGAPPVPNNAVKGTPSLAFTTPPNSQPPAAHLTRAGPDFSAGTVQIALITNVRPTLKSERPRFAFKSYQCKLDNEFEKPSPAITLEPVSMLLPHVKEPWTWKPCSNLLTIPS